MLRLKALPLSGYGLNVAASRIRGHAARRTR